MNRYFSFLVFLCLTALSIAERLPFPDCKDIINQANVVAMCTSSRIREECGQYCQGSSGTRNSPAKTPPRKTSAAPAPPAKASSEMATKQEIKCDGIKPCVNLNSANAKFSQCCKQKGVSNECAFLCDYSKSGADLQNAVLDDICPISLLENYLKCASGMQDNTKCCEKTGILNSGNEQCTGFCNPSSMKEWPKSLGQAVKYLPCLQAQSRILKCHWANLKP